MPLWQEFSLRHSTREKFVHAATLEEALKDRPHPPKPRKLDAKAEALLIATACSQPTDGRAQWTMQLLGNRLVKLQVVESISDEIVRQTLKKTRTAKLAGEPSAPDELNTLPGNGKIVVVDCACFGKP